MKRKRIYCRRCDNKTYEAAKKLKKITFKSERKTKEEETEKAKNEASKELEEEKIDRLKSDRLAGKNINPAEEAKSTKEVEEGRLKIKKSAQKRT